MPNQLGAVDKVSLMRSSVKIKSHAMTARVVSQPVLFLTILCAITQL